MTKLRRKIFICSIASLLTLCIIFSVMLIGKLLQGKPTGPLSLQALSQNYGTIQLDCTYNELKHTLAVTQTTTYINHTNRELTELKFHIYANAYQKDATYPAVAPAERERAYPNGFSEGYIKVTTPKTIINGADNTVLTIPLNTPLKPTKSTTVTLDYTIQLANVKHRLGYTAASVNLGNFYAIPIVYDHGWEIYPYCANGDPFYNEPYNFEATLHAPSGFTIAASGEAIGPNQFRGYVLRDFAFVLSRNFHVISKAVGNTTVNYYYLDDPIPDISLYTATNALAYFSNQFYNYPYHTLAVVQTDFLQGGMEYGALVYISHDVTDQQQYQTVIVHEIAHQWWYGIVGNDQTHAAWLDEGLAEYSTAVFFETHPQYGKTLASCAQDNQAAINLFESVMDEYHVPYHRDMTYDLLNYKLLSEYTINTYARGMLLFYNITEMVGYQNLNDALCQYAHAYCFAFGDKDSLATTLEDILGKDLVKYLHNYLVGNEQ